MFSVNQTVTLQVHPSEERLTARIVNATPAHLIVEIEGKHLPPIDSDVTVYLEHKGKTQQQSTTVSGHWQHSPKKTVELARIGKPVAVRLKTHAA